MNEQPNTTNAGSEVDVDAIERELTSLWKSAGEDGELGGVTRASILNLIIYARDPSESARLDDMIAEITADHPCRAILLLSDRDSAGESITAQVTSRCTLPTATSKQVCCEQVTVTARRAQVESVISVVTPLLLSDLPIYLWWRAVPSLDDKAFERLVDASDRVIIDSANFAEPYNDLKALARVINDRPRWTAFTDLNWARLSAWRGLLASFYDVADYRDLLDRIDKVTIEYAPPAAGRSLISPRALILAGWVASRLAWKLTGAAASPSEPVKVYEFSAKSNPVSLEFVPAASPEIEPGHLARVTLRSAADKSASFQVARSEDGNRIETQAVVGQQRRIQRVLSYENWKESALIRRELVILGHDRAYEQAVVAAGQIVALAGA